MYEDWVIERWDTPFSDVKSLVMVSLHDEGDLTLVVEDARHQQRRRWRVTFRRVVAYRNIMEEYRLSLPGPDRKESVRRGWAWRLTGSDWLGPLRRDEPLIDVHAAGSQHFVIVTEDDVVEALTPEEPEIEDLGPSPDAPPAGKSHVLYHPDDFDDGGDPQGDV